MHHILLIDDDEQLAPPLAQYLQRFDMALQAAHRPSQGLARLQQGGIDAVILDVMLPEMDGFEVCRRIRASGALCRFVWNATNSFRCRQRERMSGQMLEPPAQFWRWFIRMYLQWRGRMRRHWPGLVQQTDQIAASRDLSLIVRPQSFRMTQQVLTVPSQRIGEVPLYARLHAWFVQ